MYAILTNALGTTGPAPGEFLSPAIRRYMGFESVRTAVGAINQHLEMGERQGEVLVKRGCCVFLAGCVVVLTGVCLARGTVAIVAKLGGGAIMVVGGVIAGAGIGTVVTMGGIRRGLA